jgi:predicted HicB family RNase H-like nuclease
MISAEEFDRLFDEGEVDILQFCDMDNVRRPGLEKQTVAVDLPTHVVESLERTSARTGTSIHTLIEQWVEERVNATAA